MTTLNAPTPHTGLGPDQVHIDDLIEPGLLHEMLTNGYISAVRHPELGLILYNYTRKTQYSSTWNQATLLCRGLIVDPHGGVVARGFPKFFNLDEHDASALNWDEPFVVQDKMDGSLGIVFDYAGARHVATRGSFTSDQAMHASHLWRERYDSLVCWRAGTTLLVEIIYPDNRIVVNYGQRDELVTLAVLDNSSGAALDLPADWPTPIVACHPHITNLDQLRAHVTRPEKRGENEEGYVIIFSDGQRVKAKFPDYVRLHALLTNMTTRRIWEGIAVSDLYTRGYSLAQIGQYLQLDLEQDVTPIVENQPWLDQLLEALPDETDTWVRGTVQTLNREVEAVARDWEDTYQTLCQDLGTGDRAQFAARAQLYPRGIRAALFLMADSRPWMHLVWAGVKPEPDVGYSAGVHTASTSLDGSTLESLM